ncbi:glycosyltransferase family 4 protein [Patescibacteria group bacterium]
MEKKKIAIFHCAFVYSGGGERIVLEEARELKKRGYQVEVYAPTVDYKNCYPKLLRKLKVKMFLPSYFGRLPFRNAARMLATSLLAPFLIYKFLDTDIFIGANQPGIWIAFCIAKLLGKPYIVYLNQPNRIVYPRPIDRKYGWYTTVRDYHFLYRLLTFARPIILHLDKYSVQFSNAIFVNGDYIGSAIENIYSRSVINAPAASHVHSISKNQRNYLLITNRHDPQKRFDFVILALEKVLKINKKLKLIIPGPFTQHTKNLINLAKRMGIEQNVKFIGKVTESKLQNLYKKAYLYCYPSPEEDFGLGPLEAGGWGVPTVAWRNAGPTVTVVDGTTGYLAKPYDINDYAKKILKLLNNKKLRDKMGKNAYKRTKDLFSWEKHVDTLESTIKTVL